MTIICSIDIDTKSVIQEFKTNLEGEWWQLLQKRVSWQRLYRKTSKWITNYVATTKESYYQKYLFQQKNGWTRWINILVTFFGSLFGKNFFSHSFSQIYAAATVSLSAHPKMRITTIIYCSLFIAFELGVIVSIWTKCKNCTRPNTRCMVQTIKHN